MPTIAEQVHVFVKQIDAVRAQKLPKDEEAKAIKAIESQIYEIRPKPATIVGKGSIG
jgi:hypothetical protein